MESSAGVKRRAFSGFPWEQMNLESSNNVLGASILIWESATPSLPGFSMGASARASFPGVLRASTSDKPLELSRLVKQCSDILKLCRAPQPGSFRKRFQRSPWIFVDVFFWGGLKLQEKPKQRPGKGFFFVGFFFGGGLFS